MERDVKEFLHAPLAIRDDTRGTRNVIHLIVLILLCKIQNINAYILQTPQIYALDCEMVYTTWGMSLARLTLVDTMLTRVLDVVIRPTDKIIDANTRFSGLVASDFDKDNVVTFDEVCVLFVTLIYIYFYLGTSTVVRYY
jgi:hypothetical protein